MPENFLNYLSSQLDEIQTAGLKKKERLITTPQGSQIKTQATPQVLNLCANNYLGLANNPEIIDAATEAMRLWGFGMASVRFICGTQTQHHDLEVQLSRFLKQEDTILYSSCFDANTGLFETLLNSEDAIISDELNHASIIDGVRLCKAQRFRYRNNDMADLETQLQAAKSARFRLIATDGVFSMDGSFANLTDICTLADKYDAIVMVDDSHAVGFVGDNGAGTPEKFGVQDRVDIITGTLGKALGGASGGYTSARQPIVDWLRQRSRPYLFSNSLAPSIVAASSKALDLVQSQPGLRHLLWENAAYFRSSMTQAGFEILPGEHPIVPIMLGDAKVAGKLAEKMLARGVYVVAFSFPVVPQGKARIRTQISAAHSRQELEFAVEQFIAAKQEISST